jgi:inner membrane protein YidH
MTTQTTRESAKQLARSAEKLEVSGERLETGDVRRTRLAADRTLLAVERTYAAWVRTGLIALASGVGAHTALAGFVPKWVIMLDSGLLILFSAFCFVAAIWRQLVPGVPRPEPDVPRLSPWVLLFVNTSLAFVSFAALVGLWLSRT